MKNKLLLCLLLCYTNCYSYADTEAKNACQCDEKISALKEKIISLEDRLTTLENKTGSNTTATMPWICVYKGFDGPDDGYSSVGATRSIAALKAMEKCKKHDKDNGFFCREYKCYQ